MGWEFILSPVSILGLLEWVAATPWSVALHESLYMWPLVESTHVLSLALLVGTAIMLDLRLLGVAMKRAPVSELTGRLLPWTRLGFVVMLATGLLLFYATPVRNYQNIFFRLKMVLLVVAGINVWLFHSRIHRSVGEWDLAMPPPRAARVAAVVSLVAWAIVVVSGRFIAYNWFDCDIQPQSAFVNWAAGCVVPE
ncbi:MAG: hypothetical protein IT177_15800 [Acidobacteria bacterium]|nr:hypothetical protein [Acidobacteriota bacterium]